MSKKRDLYAFFGPPGAGKTSQAYFLKDRMNIHYVSWGRLSRDIVAGVGPHAKYQKKVLDIMVNDKHFPRGFIRDILISEIKLLQDDKPVLVDGFPRRNAESKDLLKVMDECDLNLSALVRFNISFDALMRRIDRRMYCRTCGRFYNAIRPSKIKGICNFDGTKLEKRMDDNKEKCRNRFDEYLEESLDAYEMLLPHADTSFDVNADQEENMLFSEVLSKLSRGMKKTHRLHIRTADTPLPTEFGVFKLVGYQNQVDYSYHLALVMGDPKGQRNVPTRIHSSCMTGDIFHSRKCDCGEQLAAAMKYVAKKKRGVVIYLLQEGRGINILNKIKAYDLQSKGVDTVDANEALGLPAEMRQYEVVDDILMDLGVKSIDLMTNNPDKFNKLHSLGVIIEKRLPLVIDSQEHSAKYLETKKSRMGHMI